MNHEIVVALIALAVVVVIVAATTVVLRKRSSRPAPPIEAQAPAPLVSTPPDRVSPVVESTPENPQAPPLRATELQTPEPIAGRLVRLRSRLSRSQNSLGRGLLTLLSRDRFDDDAWEELEDTLLMADMGVVGSQEIVSSLREKVRIEGVKDEVLLRELMRSELLDALGDPSQRVLRLDATAKPSVVLMVGVNGVGKTTTCGKVARLLIAEGSTVLLGAADTFRAAAADQLQTWGERVGATVVRGDEGADPASVAFDAVKAGLDSGVDVVLVDTAGRLQNKAGLMDELGKVKRVIEKQQPVAETLLVIDATTGQNGLTQARVFMEAVEVTGLVLTKLDGTAKGGIVFAVQRELGVPVKLVGLGEGPDDLAPFDAHEFVDGILQAG